VVVCAPLYWLYLQAMTTFNTSGKRSLDGPVRRQSSLPSIAPVNSESTPISTVVGELKQATSQAEQEPLSDSWAPVMSSNMAPEEPVFVYGKVKKVRGGIARSARWIALGLLVLVVLGGGWFGFKTLSAAHSIFAKSNGIAPALAGALNLTQLKGEGDGRVNILILGIGGQGHDGPNLSDTMMVVSIDPKTKDAAMLSIPRDLYVKIPASAKSNVTYGKINSANAYGGPQLAAQVVSNVIGVPIHYYVVVDFSGFKQAVDAVGGVDINVQTALYDPAYPCDDERGGYCPLRIAAGLQHMNGTIALRYSRSRHSTSDFDRAARQQIVLSALRAKAMQLSTLTNPVKLTALIDALGSHITTDIQPNELTKLASLAKDIDPAKTPSKVLDTDSKGALLLGGTNLIDGAGYIELPKLGNFNYSDIHDLVKNIFTDHYLVDENALLEVQNGSSIPGLAASLVSSLQAAHYNVGDPANAAEHYTTTVLYDYTGGKKPYTINYLEQRLNVKAQKMTPPTPVVNASGQPVAVPQIRIILGSDYKQANTSQ
jgi:LCP family protein required for cell wall assembly